MKAIGTQSRWPLATRTAKWSGLLHLLILLMLASRSPVLATIAGTITLPTLAFFKVVGIQIGAKSGLFLLMVVAISFFFYWALLWASTEIIPMATGRRNAIKLGLSDGSMISPADQGPEREALSKKD
jgi:hypothetical protein